MKLSFAAVTLESGKRFLVNTHFSVAFTTSLLWEECIPSEISIKRQNSSPKFLYSAAYTLHRMFP